MGSVLSSFWAPLPGSTDDPDPVTTLTTRDIYYIKKTWAKLREHTLETGMDIFINLFLLERSYQDLFSFRDVPFDELRSNKRFQAHCSNLMYGFSSLIDNIDNTDLLLELLKKQGMTHKPRGLTAKAYWDLKVVLMEMFEPQMSEIELKTWEKTIDVSFPIMIEGGK